MPTNERRRLPRPVVLLLTVLAVLPAVALAVLVGRYWINLPVSDEWTTSVGYTLAKAREGTLSVPALFAQHTESRPVFPRLVALALNVGGGEWDVRRGMVLNLALAAGISALLWRLLDRRRPAWSRWLTLAAMNALLFSPVGWEIWLWGQGYLVLLTLLCLAGILAVNASELPLRTKAGLNAALAFVGTFSFANGLLLWPLGWPGGGGQKAGGRRMKAEGGASETASPTNLWPSAFYAAAALGTFALFFVGFRAADRAAWPYALGHPGEVGRYFLTWCAVPFRPGGEPDGGHVFIGVTVVALFVAGAFRARQADRRGAWPWVALGTFALVSGGLAAVGRARGGLEFALSSRYAVTAALLPVAALGAWWTAGGFRGLWRTPGTVLVLGVAGMLYGPAFTGAVEAMRGAREAREKAREALAFVDLMPDNPQFRPVFPDLPEHPEGLRVAFHRLAAVGLVRAQLASPALETILGRVPPTGDAGAAGAFDACAPLGVEQLVVSGWASDPGALGERPAPFVAFQWTPLDAVGGSATGRPRPWTVLRVDRERPDVAKALGRPGLARCGFSEAIYRPLSADGAGPARVTAWAVDPAAGTARALGRSFEMPAASATNPPAASTSVPRRASQPAQ